MIFGQIFQLLTLTFFLKVIIRLTTFFVLMVISWKVYYKTRKKVNSKIKDFDGRKSMSKNFFSLFRRFVVAIYSCNRLEDCKGYWMRMVEGKKSRIGGTESLRMPKMCSTLFCKLHLIIALPSRTIYSLSHSLLTSFVSSWRFFYQCFKWRFINL